MNASGESNQTALLSNSSPPGVVPYHPFFTHFSDTVRVLVVLILMIVGCIANIVSLLGLSHARINQIPRGLLIIFISVADNLYLTSALVVEMSDTFIRTIRPGCAYLYVLLHAMRLWSYVLVVLFLIDRLCSVKRISWHRRLSCNFWTRVIVCVSLLLACCMSAFLLVFVHYDTTLDGYVDKKYSDPGTCVVLYPEYKGFALYLGIGLLGIGEVATELTALVCTCWIVCCLVLRRIKAKNASEAEKPKPENRNGIFDKKHAIELESQGGMALNETNVEDVGHKDSDSNSVTAVELGDSAYDSMPKCNANCNNADEADDNAKAESPGNSVGEEERDSDVGNVLDNQNDSESLGNSDAETASLKGSHDSQPERNTTSEFPRENGDISKGNCTESVEKVTDDAKDEGEKSDETEEQDTEETAAEETAAGSTDVEQGKDEADSSQLKESKGSPDYTVEASVVGAAMVLCCVPFTVSFLYSHVHYPSHVTSHVTSVWYSPALGAMQTISLAFHGIKFLLYLCSSRAFRKSMYQLCCSCLRR